MLFYMGHDVLNETGSCPPNQGRMEVNITVRFIVKNKTQFFYEKIDNLTPSESYEYVKSLGNKPEKLSLKDSVDLNMLMKRFPKITLEIQKREGYKIISYTFEESRLS